MHRVRKPPRRVARGTSPRSSVFEAFGTRAQASGAASRCGYPPTRGGTVIRKERPSTEAGQEQQRPGESETCSNYFVTAAARLVHVRRGSALARPKNKKHGLTPSGGTARAVPPMSPECVSSVGIKSKARGNQRLR